eukprot:3317095-Alexandrium_andersonii.AAC.1
MSASLVGSEMCIRDSSCPACHEVLRLAGALAAHGSALLPARREWFGRVTVSYTHLTLPTICSV